MKTFPSQYRRAYYLLPIHLIFDDINLLYNGRRFEISDFKIIETFFFT